MENDNDFEMDPPLNYYYNNQGREWSEKYHWVKTKDKTERQVLQEIHDTLSTSLNWKKNSELCNQVQVLLHMKYDRGTTTQLYHDMDLRIHELEKCNKYKSSKKINEIIDEEVREAKFCIEYFLRTYN